MIMVTHYENELPETITHRLCLTRNRLKYPADKEQTMA